MIMEQQRGREREGNHNCVRYKWISFLLSKIRSDRQLLNPVFVWRIKNIILFCAAVFLVCRIKLKIKGYSARNAMVC